MTLINLHTNSSVQFSFNFAYFICYVYHSINRHIYLIAMLICVYSLSAYYKKLIFKELSYAKT